MMAACLALAGCGGGVRAPAEVQGTWGADCTQPFVKFSGGDIQVFADNATYRLKSATLADGNLTVAYDTPQGAVSEVYAFDGQTLRLDHGTYAGTEADWHKQPMNKCS